MRVELYDRTVYVGEALTSASRVPSGATIIRFLTEEEIQEFRKTASPLAKEPWDEFHMDHSEWWQR